MTRMMNTFCERHLITGTGSAFVQRAAAKFDGGLEHGPTGMDRTQLRRQVTVQGHAVPNMQPAVGQVFLVCGASGADLRHHERVPGSPGLCGVAGCATGVSDGAGSSLSKAGRA